MDIKFTQKIAFGYCIDKIREDTYVVATTKAMKERTISIYHHEKDTHFLFSKNELTSKEKICERLEKVDSFDDILSFCKDYGTLANPHSEIINDRHFRTNSIINSHGKTTYHEEVKPKNFNPNPRFDQDFMWTNHFFYYVKTVQALSLFENLRRKKSLTTKEKIDIFKFILSYMELIYDLFLAEYKISVEGFKSYLKTYPFYYVAFLWNEGIDTDQFYKENKLADKEDIIDKENETLEPELEYDGLADFAPIIDFSINSFKEAEFIPSDMQCEQLFHRITEDIINFHIKDLPFSELILKDFSSTDSMFQSFGDAIIFQKILDINAKRHYRKCANPYCTELFPPTRENRRYCSDTCAHNVTNRKHMKNKRSAETAQNKEHQVT